MVKSIHHITIRDYSLFEQTGNPVYLMQYRLPLHRLYRKQLAALVEKIAAGLGSETDETAKMQKEYHRLKSVMRIQMLAALYQAVYNLLINKMTVETWKQAIGKGKKAVDYTSLIGYIGQIKQYAGIDFDPDCWELDMIELKEQIDRWTDKYNEAFGEKPGAASDDKLTFLHIVLGVFAVLNFPLDESTRLVTFFEMKRQAEEIANRLKLKENG
jgi:hypothetical protein